jgi:hypothetical protein
VEPPPAPLGFDPGDVFSYRLPPGFIDTLSPTVAAPESPPWQTPAIAIPGLNFPPR